MVLIHRSNMEKYIVELTKVQKIVTGLASRYPDHNEIWNGSISDQLKTVTDLMLKELTNERN